MRFPLAALRAAALLHNLGARAGAEPRGGGPNHQVESELGPLLSSGAAISIPSSLGWDEQLVRASSPRIHPGFLASVEPATEQDVQETVKYANRIGVPFLAVTGTHGWPTTLNDLRGGIQINMRRMNGTQINAGGATATAGGGVMQYEIVRTLFAQRKLAGASP